MKIFYWKIDLKFLSFVFIIVTLLFKNNLVEAFPIYAQQAYSNPREANGRIACANCHLAQKPIEIEIPQAVLPNSVFEAVVKIPYDLNNKQILGSNKRGGLNVGAVVILPDGFRLAPANQLSKEMKEKGLGIYISPYSAKDENILVVGPVSGDKHQEINFPILSPDPLTNKSVNFLKYPIYVGANRGRGQINPTGEKTNNNPILTSTSGEILNILTKENGNYEITIKSLSGEIITQIIPNSFDLIISKGTKILANQPLTKDPNMGGFGQTETEIVLQSSERIYAYSLLCFFILLTQLFLVIKKKQFEKIQISEMNF
jgi:apocytochrome f